MCRLLLLVCLSVAFAREISHPFIVLPSFLRNGTTNSIIVTPTKGHTDNVDISVTINALSGVVKIPLYSQKFKAKRAGSTYTFNFEISSTIDNAEVLVQVTRHVDFVSELRIRPDIGAIHLYTSKNIYRAGEKVETRVLPLTSAGNVFTGPLDVTLVNPDGYELTKHRIRANDGFVSLNFELPLHLFFGDWRIIARPSGYRDVDLTYDTSFVVKDYELPPFHIRLSLGEDESIRKFSLSVEASYFHGAPVDGTLVFYCIPHSKNQTSLTHRLLQSQISSGLWLGQVDVSPCFDAASLPTTILVEIRDHGTGGRGEAKTDFDPLRPGFDIIPMRPSFDTKTRKMIFVTQAAGAPNGSPLIVHLSCMSNDRHAGQDITGVIGEVINFNIPYSWANCPVIMIQATRSVYTDQSRVRILMIPSVAATDGKSVVEASWITVKTPKVFYTIGEQFEVLVPVAESKKLNYMVLCNSQAVVYSGRVRDDGEISILLSAKFLGKCILFVYSTNNSPLTDMTEFYVHDNCSASVFSSQKEMKPGQNVTFTLNGDPYGLSVLRSSDDRLNYIQPKTEAQKSRSWDFSIFDKNQAINNKKYHAKLMNFVKVDRLRVIIEKNCETAGAAYKTKYGKCPDPRLTSSCISNLCVKWMVEACRNPPTPTTSSICDERNRGRCVENIQLLKTSSMQGIFEIQTSKSRPVVSLQSLLSDAPDLPHDDGSDVRENFEEVWIFDSYSLGASGTTSVNSKSPDNIGNWAVSSAFWSPGQQELCLAPRIEVISKKNVFMQVDIPRNVYVNETITVKISVSALDLSQESKFSICMSELSRKVCGDLGSLGQHGRPTYTRVVVSKTHPIDTKTFTIRFLAAGLSSVLFRLRREESYPGKHHCEVGEVLDSIRLRIFVAKRAETEEHSKQIILNAEKPCISHAMLNDAMTSNNHIPAKNILEVQEYRSNVDPKAIVTQVSANIHDTDTVYSFSVDLSKFLTTDFAIVNPRRTKRGTLFYGNAFLSDVLKELSVELYQFRKSRMSENVDQSTLEYSENKIGILISDLLRFSDCSNETTCGFAEYGRPRNEEERSPLLTSIVSSLLCEAFADERLVCGAIGYILKYLTDRKPRPIDLHDMIDLESQNDKLWFLNAMLLQVSKDCATYQCTKNDAAWMNLYGDYYNLDESNQFDIRTIAALAFMGTNATAEIMRIKMAQSKDKSILPFWTAGNSMKKLKSRMNSFDRQNVYKKMKSGDLLVNALGVLSFISAGAETDWDPLANWVYEQQEEDGSYESALDTYFASRALFEYRSKKVNFDSDSSLQVMVECAACDTRTINVTETATEIYLPSTTKNFTLTTKGRGKAKAGVRILLTKRQRSRRGLTMDDYYPVKFTVDQQTVSMGIIKQIVCFTIMSPMMRAIEITHGFFTGYSSKPTSIGVLQNSTHLKITTIPTISSYAAHFVLEGLQHRTNQCYEIGVVEPQHNHEPNHLAPVAIAARHPINDVVGLVLISHPDQTRMKRSSVPAALFRIDAQKRSQRKPRNIVDESIDTICFHGGVCTCAETTCGVRCGMCRNDNSDELRKQFAQHDSFGAQLRVSSTQRVLVGAAYYHQIETEVREKKGGGEGLVADRLTIWLRDCNPRCFPNEGIRKADKFYIQGNTEALVNDADGRQHYVLRDMDRWERSTAECKEWAAAINLE